MDSPGPDVWIAFCTPEHCATWQDRHTAQEISAMRAVSGKDRCQWCSSPLVSGYHEEGCPVRDVVRDLRKDEEA